MFDITKIDSNFFLPFPKINQKLIDAAHHPSIHPSIHVIIIIQPQSLLSPPKVLVHFNRFNHYTAPMIPDSLLLGPTVFHQLFLLLLLHPREKFRSFISHFPSTQRTLHSPPLDPPRISRSSAPLCSTSLFFHVASHRNGRVHACPRQ